METSFSREINMNRIPYVAPPAPRNLNETIGKWPSKKGLEASTDEKKSTVMLLAVLLGAFGANNFYVGETKKGIIKVLLALSGIGLPIGWIWSIVDAVKYGKNK